MSGRARVTFDSTIVIAGVNPYVIVSAEQAATLRAGWRRPMPVRVRLNDGPAHAWRTNIMPNGDGSFRLYLHGAMRRAAVAEVGDVVTVELTVDPDYESHPDHREPEWLRSALAADRVALSNWKRLPFSRRKEVIRYLRALRSSDARDRNLARALNALRGDRVRFLGRDWEDGRSFHLDAAPGHSNPRSATGRPSASSASTRGGAPARWMTLP